MVKFKSHWYCFKYAVIQRLQAHGFESSPRLPHSGQWFPSGYFLHLVMKRSSSFHSTNSRHDGSVNGQREQYLLKAPKSRPRTLRSPCSVDIPQCRIKPREAGLDKTCRKFTVRRFNAFIGSQG
ncbi:hypothetical protein E2C01_023401 [Portunus trituberculatus]|uniref:Uncharacterized protein n=1 Tax=Portunus trituberculatus TaxID=210409 RepID=A0A5B7E834_PORTR|nr:hypothetical protein [Portunus trituberculatus]